MPSPNAVDPEVDRYPAPLEFFREDFIHPDNQAILKREDNRWRLLGFWERIKLRAYVGSLGRKLKRARYNQLVLELDELKRTVPRALRDYHRTAWTNETAKIKAQERIKAMYARGRDVQHRLAELKPTHDLYSHYAGWLEYEHQHRRELAHEAKLEKKIRREMRRESKWLEVLMSDVFRHTRGCHYTYTDKDGGKEKTKVPKFARCVIRPDAHYFYLLTSQRLLNGYRWKLPPGVTIDRLTDEEVLRNLYAATKRQVDVVWTETGQLVFRVARLDSPDALPKKVMWRDAMRYFPEAKRDKFPYTIGSVEGRKFKWFDFVSDPHILVAGKSQSGKSNLVNGIIATLVSEHSPKEVRLVLIDQKGGLEFTHWKEIPHLLWDMIKTVDEVQPVLTRLVSVMRRRMATLERVKAKDIGAYNARVDEDQRMERVWVIIDEMNTFVGLGSLTEEIHNLIMLLVSQGRAVGIHVIASTQHPEVKVVPGRIKTNMSVRLSGAMPTASASMIILDSPKAAAIPNIPGRFVAAVGLSELIVQVPYILDEDIAGIVGAARRRYPDVSNELADMTDAPKLTVWDEQRTLKAAIQWLEGHLSGQKLHKLLGEESPGERHLATMCRRIVDESRVAGVVTLLEDGSQWKIKKKGKAYHLVRQSDENEALESAETLSDHLSDPVTEAAAD